MVKETQHFPLQESRWFFSTDQINRLKAAIATSNGVIEVVVHPDYTGYIAIEKDGLKKDLLRRQQQLFSKKIEDTKPDTPLIVLAEPEYYARLESTIKASGSRATVVLPTDDSNPTPLSLTAQFFSTENIWLSFKTALKELGVHKIILSGAEIYADRTMYDGILQGCLGMTYSYLREDFTVDFTEITYPSTRTEVINRLIREGFIGE